MQTLTNKPRTKIEKDDQTMNIILTKKEVQDALKDLKRISVKSDAKHIPILLDNFLIQTVNNNINLTYSDGKLTATKIIKGTTHTPTAALFPLKKVDAALKKIKTDSVNLSSDDSGTQLSAGSNTFDYKVPPASKYPKLPKTKDTGFMIDVADLKNLLLPVLYAVSKHETRPILTAVNLIIAPDSITAVTCDSHRLVKNELKIKTDATEEKTINLQGALLDKVLKMDLGTEIEFIDNDASIVLKNDLNVVNITKVEGNYPQTDKLIPTAFTSHLTADKKELITALELAKLTVSDSKNFLVTIDDTTLKAVSSSEDFTSDLKAEKEGEALTINFNPDYLVDALKNIECKEVKLSFVSRLRPFTAQGVESNTTHLITPIRTTN